MTKYIITDPCYILDDETWSKCCKIASSDKDWDSELFNLEVSKALKQFANTNNAWVEETGFGDWSNTMHGNNAKVLEAEFCADSGMVCVCEMTPAVTNMLSARFPAGYSSLVAIIECDGNVSVTFDRSNKQWTVVYIDDDKGRFNSLIQ